MASNGSRSLLWAALALAAFAALMVWMLIVPSGADDEADETAVSAAAQEPPELPPAAASVQPAQPEPAAEKPQQPAQAQGDPDQVDLFAGPMPDFMAELHMRVLDKKDLGAHQQKQLYDYGQEHPDDARPQLLLAWDSMNRDWDGFAVRLYRMAFRADPRAKEDPSMLRDLLDIASRFDRVEYREATEVIEQAYGRDAVPRIDSEIARLRAEGSTAGVERLQKLRDRLMK